MLNLLPLSCLTVPLSRGVAITFLYVLSEQIQSVLFPWGHKQAVSSPAPKRKNSSLTCTFPSSFHSISFLISYSSDPPQIISSYCLPVPLLPPCDVLTAMSVFRPYLGSRCCRALEAFPPHPHQDHLKNILHFRVPVGWADALVEIALQPSFPQLCLLSFPFSRVYPKSTP